MKNAIKIKTSKQAMLKTCKNMRKKPKMQNTQLSKNQEKHAKHAKKGKTLQKRKTCQKIQKM